jgi:uncharacterized membrane protein YfcA
MQVQANVYMPVPKSFIFVLALAVAATFARGMVGSLGAAILIAAGLVVFGRQAIATSRKSVKRYAIGMGLYGGAFAAQASLLPTYVGSRAVDIVWGVVLVSIAIYLYFTKRLDRYFESKATALGVETDCSSNEKQGGAANR